MFHHRPTAFATNVSAIEGRVRALENELERIARTAGRHLRPACLRPAIMSVTPSPQP